MKYKSLLLAIVIFAAALASLFNAQPARANPRLADPTAMVYRGQTNIEQTCASQGTFGSGGTSTAYPVVGPYTFTGSNYHWFQFDFSADVTVSEALFEQETNSGDYARNEVVCASDDGTTWTQVASMAVVVGINTISFSEATHRYWSVASTGTYQWSKVDSITLNATASETLVWQIGNYLSDGSFEDFMWPFDWGSDWKSNTTAFGAFSRQESFTPGDYGPLCGDHFRQFDANVQGNVSQSFRWYGGNLYVSFAMRTDNATVTAGIVDPFGYVRTLTYLTTATESQWQIVSTTLDDLPKGLYSLGITVLPGTGPFGDPGKAAFDCVSISEGGYVHDAYNETPLNPPADPPPLIERTAETGIEATGDMSPAWALIPGIALAFTVTDGNFDMLPVPADIPKANGTAYDLFALTNREVVVAGNIAPEPIGISGGGGSPVSWPPTGGGASPYNVPSTYVWPAAPKGLINPWTGGPSVEQPTWPQTASSGNPYAPAKTLNTFTVVNDLNAPLPKGVNPQTDVVVLNGSEVYVSAVIGQQLVSDMQTAIHIDAPNILSIQNVATGEIIAPDDYAVQHNEFVATQWNELFQLDFSGFQKRYFPIRLPPGEYRLLAKNDTVADTLFLDRVCVGGRVFVASADCDASSDAVFDVTQTSAIQTQLAEYAQSTAISGATAAAVTATAIYQTNQTLTARAYATQTALVVSGNATQAAAATKTQAYALTATPRMALTATAFVQHGRATLTQRVAITQTKVAAIYAQQTSVAATSRAAATQRARLTLTAAVQATVAVQPNIYATMTAQAYLTQVRAGELATNAAILTQQYNAQQTAIAAMTAAPNGTTESQATAIAELNATIAALATAQAAATGVTNPTALPATAVVVSMPPEQGVTSWDVECIRPTNPLNLAWWVDYERCMILSWFAWGSSNTAQIQDLKTNVGGREPFGTILQIGDAFGNLRNSFGLFDWGLTGATCSTAPPNATIFFEQARGILAGELDLNQASSTYSDDGNMPIDVIVGPYIARGIHFFLNMLCALGIMQWFQWMADVVFVFLIIFYFKTRWIDPTFS